MVFNATFNNISIISWRSVLLVKETRVPVETTRVDYDISKMQEDNIISKLRLKLKTRGSFKNTPTIQISICQAVSEIKIFENCFIKEKVLKKNWTLC